MAGNIRRRGNSWEIAYWVGFQSCQRCTACNHRHWVSNGRLSSCPRCGGALKERTERRQQFKGGFRTKREAQRALNEALAALDNGAYVAAARYTVGEYLLECWLSAKKPRAGDGRGHRGRLGVSTWHDYHGIVKRYVEPRIGARPLQKLSGFDLNLLYDELEESGGKNGRPLSPKTVLNVHRLLHKAFNDAVREGVLARNPAAAARAPSAPKASTDIWTVKELRSFLLHVAEDPYYAAWLLFATTGMRRGEVAGLTWPNIDLDAAKLRVAMTLGVVERQATWKKRPKSKAGERTVSLDPATVDALRTHRKIQAEQRLQAGPDWQSRQQDWLGNYRDELVFTWPDGGLIHPERLSRWFRQHSKAAGLPRIRLHDVRHTYASAGLAAATGWHEVKIISDRLGHSSIGFTLDQYSHVLPTADEQTANTLARVILGP